MEYVRDGVLDCTEWLVSLDTSTRQHAESLLGAPERAGGRCFPTSASICHRRRRCCSCAACGMRWLTAIGVILRWALVETTP